jgi:hypothetical protein
MSPIMLGSVSVTAVSLVSLAGVVPVTEGQYSQEEPRGDLYGALGRRQPKLSRKEEPCSSPLKDSIERTKAVGHGSSR